MNEIGDQSQRLESLQNEVSQLLRLFVRFLKIVPGYREQAEVFEKHRPTLVSLLLQSTRYCQAKNIIQNSLELKTF